jgi:hypothetical protein
MRIEHPKVIAAVFAAAREAIPLAEYIGSRDDGEYLVLDAYRRIVGRVTFDDDGKPQVEAYKLPPGFLPN